MKNKICVLDAKTFGSDMSLNIFNEIANTTLYETTSKEQTLKHISDANIVITNKVVIDKYVMDNTNIKLICVAATGMNNIDLEYAKEKCIEVKNVVGYSSASVAQLTFSIALQFIQKVPYYNEYVLNNSWSKSDIFTHLDQPFFELENKTWGIIGLGNIGKRVANIAESFGAKIQYYSTTNKNNNTQYKNVSLNELLKTSDIISIHCALNDATNNMINRTNITTIKDKAIILNLGRGGIVNEEDIAKVLDERELYYGTDVVTKEPIVEQSALLAVQNKERIIITPHIAWASIEARKRLLNMIANNINDYLK
jgi:lactate dehydrogenase-like 2-hydroxyacid dehydrogenase